MIRSHLSLDSASAIESIERVQGLARAAGDVDLELAALAELGARLVGAGSVDEGLGLLDEAMSGSFAGECQSFLPAVWASCEMLKACEFAGDLRRATEWMRVVDDFTDRYGCPFVYASCRMRYGSLLVAKGHWSRAEQELRTAVRLSGGAGPVLEGEALARLAELRLRQGRLEDAEALVSEVHDELAAGLTIARVRSARGESVTALLERYYALALHIAERAAALAMLVDAYLAGSQLGPASAAAEQLDALAEVARGGDTGALAAWLRPVSTAKGEPDRAVVDFTRALDLFRSWTCRWRAPGCVWISPERRRPQPQRRGGGSPPRPHPLRSAWRHGGRRCRGGVPSVPRSHGQTSAPCDAALTKREEEVLHLIGLGLSNPEIAQRLYISRNTAAHHVNNVLVNYLRNRSEAAAYMH